MTTAAWRPKKEKIRTPRRPRPSVLGSRTRNIREKAAACGRRETKIVVYSPENENLDDMPGKSRKKAPTLCMEASNSSVATCSNVTCPTCSEFVRDATAENEGQEALFCEGTCQCWYHRLCVGVGQVRFQKLTESSEPFLCPTCTSENQQKATEELRGNVQALTTEILELKAAMAGLQKLSNSTAADRPTETGGGGIVVKQLQKQLEWVSCLGML